MGLLDFILQECMDWLHDAHRVVWTVLMLLLLAFLGGCTAILFLARHWAGGVFLGILTLIYLAFLIHRLIAKPKPSQRGWHSCFDKPPQETLNVYKNRPVLQLVLFYLRLYKGRLTVCSAPGGLCRRAVRRPAAAAPG